MSHFKSLAVALSVGLVIGVCFTPIANAGTYTLTILSGLSGAAHIYATGINNAGQVVGYSNATIGGGSYQAYQAVLWDGTPTPTILSGLSGSRDSHAYGINNAGQVVGYSDTTIGGGSYQAVLWNGTTTPTALGDLGWDSAATGINDAGQVVGYSNVGYTSVMQAVLWNGTTTPTALGGLGGESGATGINNAGQVVGYSNPTIVGGPYQAVLWNGTTTPTVLGSLGGNKSSATGINNAGQVVGYSNATIGGGSYQAVLWDGTTAIDLNSFLSASTLGAGWDLITATGINDNGWIVGDAYNSISSGTGYDYAFLLSPGPQNFVSAPPPIPTIPEPETYAMLLAGLALIGFIAYRRKSDSSIMLGTA
jgi:probable HAF family extracellular repeat protein